MKLYLINHDFRYAVEQALLTLFPAERPEYPAEHTDGDRAETALSYDGIMADAVTYLYLGRECYTGRAGVSAARFTDELERKRLLNYIVKLSFYRAALASGVPKPVWGSLTGIRPGKIVSGYLAAGLEEGAALRKLCAEYDCSRPRAELCLDTARAERRAAASLERGDICLYVGIPFCPTRCAYCSFVSNSVEKSGKLVEPFLEALSWELDATAAAARELGLRPVSVYFGGGTPTTLSAPQLDALLTRMEGAFDLSRLRETTVEAGRPDTITAEKLAVLRAHGVTRVSVNPQTMSDEVLERIGRRHTAADILSALSLVRAAGDFQVNMDLIAGLPGDTPEGFERTLDAVLALGPENITVHTLSKKKGSRITEENSALPEAAAVGSMLDYAGARLRGEGYSPYYLYRQKFMSGGFENVGWTKPGAENLYNICVMEELCTILAMGGGASTKLVSGTGRIERVFAPKYPLEYIQRIEKTVSDKDIIKEFYNGI